MSTKRHLDPTDVDDNDTTLAKKQFLRSNEDLLLDQLPAHILCNALRKFPAKSLARFHQTSSAAHKFVEDNHTKIAIPVLLVIDEVSSMVGPADDDTFAQKGLPVLGGKSGFTTCAIRLDVFYDEEAPDEFNITTSNILANVAEFPNTPVYIIWKDAERPSCETVTSGSPVPIEFIRKIPLVTFINGALFETGMLNWWNQYETDHDRETATLNGARCWELILKYEEARLWWSAEEGIGLFRILLLEWINCLDMGRCKFLSIAFNFTGKEFKDPFKQVFAGIHYTEIDHGLLKNYLFHDERVWMQREDDVLCECELHDPNYRLPPSVILHEIRNKKNQCATVAIAHCLCGWWLGFVRNTADDAKYFKLLKNIPGFTEASSQKTEAVSEDHKDTFDDKAEDPVMGEGKYSEGTVDSPESME